MRNDDLNRRTDLDRGTGMGGMMLAALAALAVIAVLFMWAPWSGPRTADNAKPGTTVGSSTTQPAAPAPAPAPATPAAPLTTR